MATELTVKTFETEVRTSPEPVLIDFYANWCMPCKMLAPIIEDVAREMPDARIYKVNIDEEPELARQFGVMSIPTLVVMKAGEVQNVAVGLRPKQDIMNMLSV